MQNSIHVKKENCFKKSFCSYAMINRFQWLRKSFIGKLILVQNATSITNPWKTRQFKNCGSGRVNCRKALNIILSKYTQRHSIISVGQKVSSLKKGGINNQMMIGSIVLMPMKIFEPVHPIKRVRVISKQLLSVPAFLTRIVQTFCKVRKLRLI